MRSGQLIGCQLLVDGGKCDYDAFFLAGHIVYKYLIYNLYSHIPHKNINQVHSWPWEQIHILWPICSKKFKAEKDCKMQLKAPERLPSGPWLFLFVCFFVKNLELNLELGTLSYVFDQVLFFVELWSKMCYIFVYYYIFSILS